MSLETSLRRTERLTVLELSVLRELCDEAFRQSDAPRGSRGVGFTDEDWADACGGVRAIALEDGRP